MIIEKLQQTLDSLQGLPLLQGVIDYFYKEGLVTDEDYERFYLDKTGLFKPTLIDVERDMSLVEAIHAKCEREEKVEIQHKMLYDAEQRAHLMSLFE